MPAICLPAVGTVLRRSLPCLVLTALSALSMPVAHAWDEVETGTGRDAIRTWVRAVPGLAVKQFKGETEVPYPLNAVLAEITDVDSMPHWIYQCNAAEQPEGRPVSQVHLRFDGIWPASPRDVLLQNRVTQDADGVVSVISQAVPGLPPTPDHVRMPMLNNTFTLVPLPGRWTRVTFQTQVDLGGKVPVWLANLISTKAPLVTLQGIRQRLAQRPPAAPSTDHWPMALHEGAKPFLPDAHVKAAAP